MAKFLFTAAYTADGLRGLLKDGGSGRVDAARKAAESVGGRLEAMYYSFGDRDAYIICELPDNRAAAALSLVVGASGAVDTKTVVLLTAEEVDGAAQAAVDFRAPGA
ncbi:GYD domain-containing protein [Asanoa sp. NPDC049573]|uniref:GYD domain-containing protein n=1 Tax=Asanoa sp. NPDC049573 TaxID=3155396 RepID=UPI0034456A31